MDKRKFRIWLAAFAAVFLVYLVYNFITVTPEIKIHEEQDGEDIEVPDFSGQQGDTRVGKVDEARFTVLDEETKELKRVFGFDKLLNPEDNNNKWHLLKPYMNFYDNKFDCEIVSDEGDVEVEVVAGKYRPTNALLYDNVIIKIIPKKEGQMGATIYLDTLAYNSERSEYSTDGPVKVVSEKAVMEGVGMLLIYNNALTRVEFLKVVDLDYIRIIDVSEYDMGEKKAVQPSIASDQQKDDTLVSEQQENETIASQQQKNDIDSGAMVGSEKDQVADAKPSGESDGVEKKDPSKFYKCQFYNDVAIKYGDELIVTGQDEIAINNILWSSGTKKGEAEESPEKEGSPEQEDLLEQEETSALGVEQGAGVAKPVEQGQEPDAYAVVQEPASVEQNGVEVLVKCSGGFTVKPLDSFITLTQLDSNSTNNTFDDTLRDILAKYDDVDWRVDDPENPPILFGSKKIDYDMETGGAVAKTDVELTLYSDEKPQEETLIGKPIPSVIRARGKAEFFATEDRSINKVVFSDDVVGTRETFTPAYKQISKFYGKKLIVDLQEQGGSEIEHITVRDGKTRLEMERISSGKTINHVRLSCKRIDYDPLVDIITAKGPGKIEINNENAPYNKEEDKDKTSRLSLKKPCFAFIEGFDELKWFASESYITADGKEKSIYMSYLPVVEGERGEVVRSSVTHLKANFVETDAGRNELSKMETWGGVHYEEQAGHEFIGDKLFYNVDDSMMIVTGTKGRQCFANGALVPRIEYNLANGRLKTKLSSSPGIFFMPKKKK
jgi:Lipopolysaccharide-assembly, LptC-related